MINPIQIVRPSQPVAYFLSLLGLYDHNLVLPCLLLPGHVLFFHIKLSLWVSLKNLFNYLEFLMASLKACLHIYDSDNVRETLYCFYNK